MRDISHKNRTLRIATAQAVVRMSAPTMALLRNHELPKGDALEVARVAAIQAAKDTSRIIPYCHPVPIDFAAIEFDLGDAGLTITATVKAIYRTGVEMEALTAAGVAALTIYDMAKMVDDGMEITSVRLLTKHGGKSDFSDSFAVPPRAAVLVLSDSAAAGQRAEGSGKLIAGLLEEYGVKVEDLRVIADDAEAAAAALIDYADRRRLDLVLTTGGTGVSHRDVTPEATRRVLDFEVGGITEAIRAYGQERLPYAMLSRALAGMRGDTLIINLPGSPAAVADALHAVFPAVLHSLPMRRGGGHAADGDGREPGELA